jgi:hypothetical protein
VATRHAKVRAPQFTPTFLTGRESSGQWLVVRLVIGAIVGATVTATETGTNQTRTATTNSMDFKLNVGETSQAIEVAGGPALVNTENA